MRKLILEIRDGIPEANALYMVQRVVQDGRISKARNMAQYCFVTMFSTLDKNIKYRVIARQKTNLNTDSFIVEKGK